MSPANALGRQARAWARIRRSHGFVDRLDRTPRRVLADGQDGEGDVLRRIVAEHAADSDVYAFLPTAADDVIRIRLELEAGPIMLSPAPRALCLALGDRSSAALPRLFEKRLDEGLDLLAIDGIARTRHVG